MRLLPATALIALAGLSLCAPASATWTERGSIDLRYRGVGYQAHQPLGFTRLPSGEMLVADGRDGGGLRRFAADGTPVRDYGTSDLVHPQGVVSDGTSAWVTDCDANRVMTVDLPSGRVTQLYGATEATQTQVPGAGLGCPQGVARGPADGFLYVADAFNNRVVVLNPEASGGERLVRVITTGNLRLTREIAFDTDGTFLVSSLGDRCTTPPLFRFRTDGTFVRTDFTAGQRSGEIFCAQGMTYGPDRTLFVADSTSRVQEIRPDGTVAGLVGTPTSATTAVVGGTTFVTEIRVESPCVLTLLDRDQNALKTFGKDGVPGCTAPAAVAPPVPSPPAPVTRPETATAGLRPFVRFLTPTRLTRARTVGLRVRCPASVATCRLRLDITVPVGPGRPLARARQANGSILVSARSDRDTRASFRFTRADVARIRARRRAAGTVRISAVAEVSGPTAGDFLPGFQRVLLAR